MKGIRIILLSDPPATPPDHPTLLDPPLLRGLIDFGGNKFILHRPPVEKARGIYFPTAAPTLCRHHVVKHVTTLTSFGGRGL